MTIKPQLRHKIRLLGASQKRKVLPARLAKATAISSKARQCTKPTCFLRNFQREASTDVFELAGLCPQNHAHCEEFSAPNFRLNCFYSRYMTMASNCEMPRTRQRARKHWWEIPPKREGSKRSVTPAPPPDLVPLPIRQRTPARLHLGAPSRNLNPSI